MNKVLTGFFEPVLSFAVGLTLIGSANIAQAASFVLYDGSQGTTPNTSNPQWLAFGNLGGTQTYKNAIAATNLNTSTNALQAGYSNYNGATLVNSQFPILDRALGYTLSFSVEILSESHANTQRAGFSIVAISSDVNSGVRSSIELGFQNERVFAQNDSPLFGTPVANETAFDPVGVGFVDYDLVVLGDSYELFAKGGSLTQKSSILKGSLRDYTAFSGAIDPYETPNFIFFGDNTTSARANINFRSASIALNDPEPVSVPEPAAILGLLSLMAGGTFKKSRNEEKNREKRNSSENKERSQNKEV
jgi:hypothetical protein